MFPKAYESIAGHIGITVFSSQSAATCMRWKSFKKYNVFLQRQLPRLPERKLRHWEYLLSVTLYTHTYLCGFITKSTIVLLRDRRCIAKILLNMNNSKNNKYTFFLVKQITHIFVCYFQLLKKIFRLNNKQ